MCSHFALLVPSCCDKFGTSFYHLNLLQRLLTITGLVQVVPIRLIQAVCNKFLRASYPVSDLLEQPCNKSDNAIKLVTSC
jgi:hypothetical protein